MEAIIDAFAPTVLFLLFIVLIITIARTRGISWDKGEPKGEIIIAKLSEKFSHTKSGYEVLYYSTLKGVYYDVCGEEIPYTAIEKFAVIKD